ncbi:MAG: hypothetical protein JO091_06805 [Acidobacteriaceae bacterium]|nr:hypothetical protein [Acidobacteriaceae bacterium]
MRFVFKTIPLAFALCLGTTLVQAQSGPDVFFGVGTATDSSSNTSIDTFGTGNPFTSPKLGGTFGKAGADFMLGHHFGIGAETDWKFSQGAYAGLKYRPLFYDFNAIWMPTGQTERRVVPELQAGIGGARLSFYAPSSSCDQFAGCSTSNSFVESSNHFQVHLGAGVRLYMTRHIFIRPQVDAHYVNNFFQFGSNWVPEYGASLGWSFGAH